MRRSGCRWRMRGRSRRGCLCCSRSGRRGPRQFYPCFARLCILASLVYDSPSANWQCTTGVKAAGVSPRERQVAGVPPTPGQRGFHLAERQERGLRPLRGWGYSPWGRKERRDWLSGKGWRWREGCICLLLPEMDGWMIGFGRASAWRNHAHIAAQSMAGRRSQGFKA